MNDDIKTLVLLAMKRAFPAYPATVQESPEDSKTLWVHVFAVPVEQVRVVKDFIHDIEDGLPAAASAVLLPMVKNLAVTRQYYQEYAPAALQVQFDDVRLVLYPSSPECAHWSPKLAASKATSANWELALAA